MELTFEEYCNWYGVKIPKDSIDIEREFMYRIKFLWENKSNKDILLDIIQ
jgi:hypothetical protein